MAIKGKETPGVTSMLSLRFKYVIGIGVGAGAYVLAKFAVSLPTTTPGPANPRTGSPRGNLQELSEFFLPLLLPLLPLHLEKSFFLSFLQGN